MKKSCRTCKHRGTEYRFGGFWCSRWCRRKHITLIPYYPVCEAYDPPGTPIKDKSE